MKRKKPTTNTPTTNTVSSNSSISNNNNEAVVMAAPSLASSSSSRNKMMKKRTKKNQTPPSSSMDSTTTTNSTSTSTTISTGWKPIDNSELILYNDDSDHHHHHHSNSNNMVMNYDQNHYDNNDDDPDHEDHTESDNTQQQKRQKRWTSSKVVQSDLLGQPHEPMGFFYRLEVMDGNVASALLISSSQSQSSSNTNNSSNKNNMTTTTSTSPKVEENITNAASTTATTTNISAITTQPPLHNKNVAVTNVVDRPTKKPKLIIKDSTTTTASTSTSTTTTKTKNKKTTSTTTISSDENVTTLTTTTPDDDNNNIDDSLILQVQNIWFKECHYAVQLHPMICHTLVQEGWMTPTPIQSISLPATILGQSNFVGAAPTGSGKTLAFLLPIFHTIYTQLDDEHDNDNEKSSLPLPLQALIVTPTRELALQIYHVGMKFCITTTPSAISPSTTTIHTHAKRYSTVSMACITGGLAAAKQIRILQSKYRPPTLLVGTPGRLWELLSSRLYPHLNNLSQLRFLVIDEADQMVDMKVTPSSSKSRRYKFPELIQILNVIHTANPMNENVEEEDDNDDDDDDDDEDMDTNRMLGLPGIPGEARVTMMNETLLQQIQQQEEQEEEGSENVNNEYNYENDVDDEEEDDEDILIANDDTDLQNNNINHGIDDEEDDISLPVLPPVRRQTFVFSATLTLPDSGKYRNDDGKQSSANDGKKKNKKKKSTNDHHDKSNQQKNDALSNVHGAIADLLQKAHAVGRTKVVDLTNGTDIGMTRTSSTVVASPNTKSSSSSQATLAPVTKEFQFPPGLQFQQMLCTQRHKDSHLYGYILYFMSSLSKTQQSSNQSSILIFCNSIAGVRRVGMTLTTLRLPVRILHANMQQRARFKAVESLQQEDNADGKNQFPTIVVATDVAARGLDIPSVATVIHYDAARTVDTFIHRSGRTARGIGDGAVGCSVSIVASGEDQVHNRIKKMLNVQFQEVPIDGRLLRIAQERVNLACKVATADDTDRKNQRDDQWFIDQAKQAGLEVDDDLLNNVIRDADDVGSRRNKDSNMRMKARQKEAEIARKKLNELLSQPVQTQRYGKFFRVGSG